MAAREDILGIFPEGMRNRWRRAAEYGDRLQEIRLRAGRPVLTSGGTDVKFLNQLSGMALNLVPL